MRSVMLTDTVTHSPEETEAVGARLAKMMEAGSLPTFVALYGDLGVGKTAFVRGFASVTSPAQQSARPHLRL